MWMSVKLRSPNTIGADHTRSYRGSKRGQAVTIDRLSLSIPSHTGREVSLQGSKAISPCGSSRSIAHIQTSDWGTGQRPWSSGRKGRSARPYAHGCRILRKSKGWLGDLRPWLSNEWWEAIRAFSASGLCSGRLAPLCFSPYSTSWNSVVSISYLSSLQSFVSCSIPAYLHLLGGLLIKVRKEALRWSTTTNISFYTK